MRAWINANETIREDDHATVQAAIRLAIEENCRKVVIPRYNARTKRMVWSFDRAIELPSNFTLVLDNCFLEQARGSYENLITNERSHDLEYSDKPENEARNIAVLGEGNVTLSGGVHNHLLEKTTRKYGLGRMFHQPILFWHNVRGLRVENLHFENFRWWCILHVMVSHAVLRNLDFFAVPHVPNLDGIDLRLGCHHFFIENVTGRTGDDTIALTGLMGKSEVDYLVEGHEIDIRDVRIRNLKADGNRCYLIRLLNHDGCREYGIEADVVMDASDWSDGNLNNAAIAVGSPYYFAKTPSVPGDTRDLRFSNIYARGKAVLALNHTIRDSCFTNVHPFGTCGPLINSFEEGCDFDNVTVGPAYVGPDGIGTGNGSFETGKEALTWRS